MNTRRQNLLFIIKTPVAIVLFGMMMAWMMLSLVIILPVVFLLLGPSEILLLLSIFVGLIHPKTGHRMTQPMEWSLNVLEATIDLLWGKPFDLIEAIL